MRLTFPALKASCEPHTVQVGGRTLAGSLVRHSGSRKALGYVWRVGDFCWAWRTPDGEHFGERANQRAAVEVLVDYAKLGDDSTAVYTRALPFEVEPPPVKPSLRDRLAGRDKPKRHEKDIEKTVERPAPKKKAKPKLEVTWSEAPDLTDAVANALKKRGGP